MRVLVVEDEPDLLRTIAQVLREDGYAVDEAADGQEGLYKATTWDYDAVVLDLLMPKLTGWQVLEQMRQTHQTPVLILTARDGVNDRVRGLDGGADDYLVKPFHLTELKARLRALIRRSKGVATSAIMVGELTVDTLAKTVTRGETRILLTPREFALLELFERFYRVDAARSRQHGGSGLGLAICKSLVEAHRGRISCESTLGQGSVFVVRLPLLTSLRHLVARNLDKETDDGVVPGP